MIDNNYIPDRGDLVWINFNPQAGHEQAGRRPAVVISPLSYNKKVGLAILCPVTSVMSSIYCWVFILTFNIFFNIFPQRLNNHKSFEVINEKIHCSII